MVLHDLYVVKEGQDLQASDAVEGTLHMRYTDAAGLHFVRPDGTISYLESGPTPWAAPWPAALAEFSARASHVTLRLNNMEDDVRSLLHSLVDAVEASSADESAGVAELRAAFVGASLARGDAATAAASRRHSPARGPQPGDVYRGRGATVPRRGECCGPRCGPRCGACERRRECRGPRLRLRNAAPLVAKGC